ncbi:MAG: DUF4139 domain-containing protein [Planctomycetota bacterium]
MHPTRRPFARLTTRALLAGLALSLCPVAVAPAPALAQDAAEEVSQDRALVDLPLRRITLYSSGVGHLIHHGQVTGDGRVRLQLTEAQLNDALKSLTVFDDPGRVDVRYPTREPLNRKLGSFAIDLSGAPTLAQIIEQLRGRSVTLSTPGPVSGVVVGVETETRIVGEPRTQVTEHLVTLMTDGQLKRIPLSSITSVLPNDPELRDELSQALATLAEASDTRTQPLDVRFASDKPDPRDVGVSYLIETPVWKTSYRLDLTQDEPQLQGWAIVENTTDADWDDIEVALVSGRPVSFVQDLYTPLFLARPEVQNELYAGLAPARYAEGSGLQPARESDVRLRRGASSGRQNFYAESADMAMPAAAPMQAGAAISGRRFETSNVAVTLDAAATGADLGELFRYLIDQPVTLERGKSAMLPILDQTVEVDRLSIFNPASHPRHPMLGVRLTNTTDLKLQGGPVTVLDAAAYAGDAQVGFMGPGDDRLLSYGLDLEVRVDASQKSNSELVGGSISRGVLRLQRRQVRTQTYDVQNDAGADRTVLIEHPRLSGYELQATDGQDGPVETTDTLYRFEVAAPKDDSGSVTVTQTRIAWEGLSLVNQNPDQLLAQSRGAAIPQDVRAALEDLASRKRAVSEVQQRIAKIDEVYSQINYDQQRVRENMRGLDRNSPLYQTYVEKLTAQETEVGQLQAEKMTLRERLSELQADLAEHIDNLRVGG